MSRRKNEIQVTSAEWDVMLSLWGLEDENIGKPAAFAAGKLIERVQLVRDWNHRTIRTLISRLVEKEAMQVQIDGAKHLYRSAVNKEDCVRVAAKSFATQFFDGDAKSMLLHFVENEQLSETDLEEIRQSLNARKKKIGKPPKSKKKKGKS